MHSLIFAVIIDAEDRTVSDLQATIGGSIDAPVNWEPDIRAFERRDKTDPPAPGGILFVGSSTFTLWDTLEADFAPLSVTNRGFGGSNMSDIVRYAPRIILPYQPAQVVVYAGDNDLANGVMPRQVFHDYHRLADTVHASLPKTLVSFISIKPSPERWSLREAIRVTNHLVEAYTKDHPATSFIDTYSLTLGHDSLPRPELYSDGLHLNRAGYELWIPIVKAALVG